MKGCDLLNKSVVYDWRVIWLQRSLLKSELARCSLANMSNPCCSQKCTQSSVSKCHRTIWSFSLQDNWSESIPSDLKSPSVSYGDEDGRIYYRNHFDPRSHSETCEDYNILKENISLLKLAEALLTCSQIVATSLHWTYSWAGEDIQNYISLEIKRKIGGTESQQRLSSITCGRLKYLSWFWMA